MKECCSVCVCVWREKCNTGALQRLHCHERDSVQHLDCVAVRVCVFLSAASSDVEKLTDVKCWSQALQIRSVLLPLLALFHCMVRHGTVRYGSLLGGFPLGTVPGT